MAEQEKKIIVSDCYCSRRCGRILYSYTQWKFTIYSASCRRNCLKGNMSDRALFLKENFPTATIFHRQNSISFYINVNYDNKQGEIYGIECIVNCTTEAKDKRTMQN